jgi:hypothetical protein
MGPFKHIAVHLPSAGRAPPEEADARQDGDGFHGKRWREYVLLPLPSSASAKPACMGAFSSSGVRSALQELLPIFHHIQR